MRVYAEGFLRGLIAGMGLGGVDRRNAEWAIDVLCEGGETEESSQQDERVSEFWCAACGGTYQGASKTFPDTCSFCLHNFDEQDGDNEESKSQDGDVGMTFLTIGPAVPTATSPCPAWPSDPAEFLPDVPF